MRLRVADKVLKLDTYELTKRRIGVQSSHPKIESRIQRQAIKQRTDALREGVINDLVENLEWIRGAVVGAADSVQVISLIHASVMTPQKRLREEGSFLTVVKGKGRRLGHILPLDDNPFENHFLGR